MQTLRYKENDDIMCVAPRKPRLSEKRTIDLSDNVALFRDAPTHVFPRFASAIIIYFDF